MKFTHLSVLAIFFLGLVGINGSKSGEEYWKSVWPNTPMPKSLSDLLLPESDTSMPIKGHEEKQYWTVFFEHDLYPGKKMSLGIQKHSDIKPSQSEAQVLVNKASQSFGTRKWLGKTTEKANQPFGLRIWEEKATEAQTEKVNQPFGLRIWEEKATEEQTEKANQPFGLRIWEEKATEAQTEKANQPFGLRIWEEKATQEQTEKANQPFGLRIWEEKATEAQTEKANQPFGLRIWEEKAIEAQTKKVNQPFGLRIWEEKATEAQIEKANQPFGLRIWEEKATEAQTEKANQPFGILTWVEKTTKALTEKGNEPFETRTWTEKEIEGETEKANQPFGFFSWTEKATETETKKVSKPFRTRKWNDKAIAKETEKASRHSVAHTLDENEAHILHEYCGRPSAIGEDKHCAPSLESMMDFAISKLGKNIKVMSSSFSQNQDQYVVEEVKKIGDNAVMCHRLNFKKVVFYCHEVNATTTYMVPLVASDGTKSKALTICHHDTRGMDPNVLYDVLKVKPGTVPVCHFIGNKAIAWVPNDVVSDSEDHPCVI